MNLPKPSCRLGYTHDDLAAIFPPGSAMQAFDDWMYGQTTAYCISSNANFCGIEHGAIVYRGDVARYLSGTDPKATWD